MCGVQASSSVIQLLSAAPDDLPYSVTYLQLESHEPYSIQRPNLSAVSVLKQFQ